MLPTIRSGELAREALTSWSEPAMPMGAVTMKLSDCQLLASLLSPTWPQLSAPTHTVCCPTLRPAVLKPPPKSCDTQPPANW